MGTIRTTRNYNLDPFVAEAMTLVTATQFCRDAGFNNLMVEGDTLNIVK